ncbi:DUF2793 domain-containing protein [Pseudooceanicola sp. LIPI14-2-Ac024]|uniref:DUF2793 domain-containing protein n=1 Tax=Pseudooceanicola sp. LIPI14-2-Ac024 TaxID=3344875 RepID=UPI0035CF9EE5
MTDHSARLNLPFIAPAQAQKHVTHNEALVQLDALVQLVLEGVDANDPPVIPAAGEIHATGPAPTGAWSGQAGTLAQWDGSAWRFLLPQEGWLAWDRAAGVIRAFTGGGWGEVSDFGAPTLLGINTSADTSNRLAVAADATLLNHDGDDHRLKINKASAGDTAAVLFQSGFSGHAEFGLTGDSDFHLKVSPDGSAWTEALVFDAATGHATGAAVQANATDGTTGRLLRAGAFGLGTEGWTETGGTWALADLERTQFSTHAAASAPSDAPAGTDGAALTIAGWEAGRSNFQLWADMEAADTAVYVRIRNDNAAFNPWSRLVHLGNLLGTVSESAGLPTGAVIERGSNANGEYLRLADGTQICTTDTLDVSACDTADGALYVSATATWTLPASFAAAPVCRFEVDDLSYWASAAAPGTTSCDFRAVGAVSTAASLALRGVAIGRWF